MSRASSGYATAVVRATAHDARSSRVRPRATGDLFLRAMPAAGPESVGSLSGGTEQIEEHVGDELVSEPARSVQTATSGDEDTAAGASASALAPPAETIEPSGEAAPATPAAAPAPVRAAIRGPREMWYFDGETPASYTVATQVTANKAGGVFAWNTSAHLTLSSAAAASPTVTTAARTAARRDAWIALRHTDGAGLVTSASYRLTVLEPRTLAHLNTVNAADPVWGYDTEVHYSIRDQFGTDLPRNVPINEQWTGGVVADAAGMDWRRGAEGSATVNPANWFDHIQGETAGHTPAPVGPGHAAAGSAVYHWPGDWRVGSLTIGNGSTVASVTWRKNRGTASHT